MVASRDSAHSRWPSFAHSTPVETRSTSAHPATCSGSATSPATSTQSSSKAVRGSGPWSSAGTSRSAMARS